MRRRSRFKIPTKYILLALTVFCIAAMYISFSLNLTGGPLNSVAGAIFGPMQRGINVMGTWISDKADNFKQLNEVMAENNFSFENLMNSIKENNTRAGGMAKSAVNQLMTL